MPSLSRLLRRRSRPAAAAAAAAAAALAGILLPLGAPLRAQAAADDAPAAWYERLSLRGYAQVRYNRLLETNPALQCDQCDRSIGEGGGFFIRRARLVVSGAVHPRVSVYIQPDLATAVSGEQHVLQMRDLYGDVYLDAARTVRLRIGQSKVPYGFENLQSSSNRLPLDRGDALNSGAPNERDLGIVAMWSTPEARRRFRILTDSGLKGSGDYGVLALAAMNGQSANEDEANEGRHVTARASYPFRLANGQFVEAGVSGYVGRFVPPSRTAGVAGPEQFGDERVAAHVVVYPQPFGVAAEWTTGRGPQFVPGESRIETGRLEGGYVQAMYRATFGDVELIPFARAQYYEGGKKHERDARRYDVRELEFGAEWLPWEALELTATYVVADRRYEDAERPDNRQRGQFLRLQAQLNY